MSALGPSVFVHVVLCNANAMFYVFCHVVFFKFLFQHHISVNAIDFAFAVFVVCMF